MSRTGDAVHNRPPLSGVAPAGVNPDVFHSGQVDAARAHHDVLRGLDGKQVCPFCGSVSERSSVPCQRCGMDNTPDARKATKARIGPWYVLQARNPAAPGMRFETLLSFVRKGRVRARSVVRGPTTHQLWRFAAHVKGLSREFGLCFSCGSAIDTTANICPQCNRLQEPPVNPDVLLEDGSEAAADASRPAVYRELPGPAAADNPAPASEPEPAPKPEDADIVIPALSGFGFDDPEPAPQTSPFSTAPLNSPTAPPSDVAPNGAATSPAKSEPQARPQPQARPSQQQTPAARPAAPEDNPFAISPPRKKGNGDASFLSAKELAAAFKLSFDPSANLDAVDVPDQMPADALPEGPRAGAPRRPQPPAAMAGTLTRPAPAARAGRGGGFRRFVLFCLILVVTGLAVLMWVDPDFRGRSVQWCKSTVAKLHAYGSGTDNQPAGKSAGGGKAGAPAATVERPFDVPDPPASTPVRPSATTAPATPPAESTPRPAEAVPRTAEGNRAAPKDPLPAPPEVRKPASDEGAQPAAAKSAASPASPSTREVVKRPPSAAPAPAPRPSAARPQPPGQGGQPAPPPQSPASAADRQAAADTLYRQGVVAQGRGDYAAAVEAYKALKKLPREYWRNDLDSRLARSETKLKQQ
jgi:hypothetical protein